MNGKTLKFWLPILLLAMAVAGNWARVEVTLANEKEERLENEDKLDRIEQRTQDIRVDQAVTRSLVEEMTKQLRRLVEREGQ